MLMATSNGKRAHGKIVPGQALPVLRYAHIAGWGKALPERILTNFDLEAIVDTNDEWIRSRTGIRERRIAADTESTTQLAVKAAQAALQVANILPTEVDLIVVATSTPEHIFPSTASLVQDQLGASHAGAYDLGAACSGFVYALDMAAAKIRAGDVDTAVVIGAETMSRVLNWSDRGTCILFGDGAGAVVLKASNEPGGLQSSVLRSDGAGWDMLGVPTVGSRDTYLQQHALTRLAAQAESFTQRVQSLTSTNTTPTVAASEDDAPERELHRLHMNGREVYKFATRVVSDSIKEAVLKSPVELEDIALIIPHQANQRIIDHIAKQLKVSGDKVYSNVAKYGNTSAASIPIALCEAVEENRIKAGDYFVMTGFGGGLSWATMVFQWSAEPEEEHKIMDFRRRVIYWYALRRRDWLRFWRNVEWFFGKRDPSEKVKEWRDRLTSTNTGDNPRTTNTDGNKK